MIYIIGAVAVDLIAQKNHFMQGTSNPADIRLSPGGVGYRIFRHLNAPKRLITAVGSDVHARWIEDNITEKHEIILKHIPEQKTALYMALMEDGELKYAASDMRIIEEGLTLSLVEENLGQIKQEDFLVMEANLSVPLVKALIARYASRTRCVFESVSVEKLQRHLGSLHDLYMLSTNRDEFDVLPGLCSDLREADSAFSFLRERKIKYLLVTRGKDGVRLYGRNRRKDFKPARLIRSDNTTGAGDMLLSRILELLDQKVMVEEAVPDAMRAVEEALEEGNL